MIYESVPSWPAAFFYSVLVICIAVVLVAFFYFMDKQ